MSRFTIAVASAIVCLGLPTLSLAQYCPDTQIVQCGDSISGNTSTQQSWLAVYGCNPGTNYTGPESSYLLVLDQCTYVDITVTPTGFDTVLFVIADILGTCRADQCLVGADLGWAGAAETVFRDLSAGTYYIQVEGTNAFNSGPFQLDVVCSPNPGCVDADGDGQAAEGSCECASDCDDGDPTIYSGALEICSDAIDQNCDGFDEACPNCAPTQAASCNLMGSTDMGPLNNNIIDWCLAGEDYWLGNEAIFKINMADDTGVVFTTTEPQDIDVMVVAGFADDTCNPNYCLAYSVAPDTGDEDVVFVARAGRDYYIAVDGWASASPSFDWTLSCLDQVCSPGETIACGDTLSGTNAGQPNQVDLYRNLNYLLQAGETVYTFNPANDGLVTALLTFGANLDLALIVLEDDGGACNPKNMLAVSDLLQESGPAEETLTFQATAGSTYYLVVDGYTAADEGAYSLNLTCVTVCPQGTSDCSGECADLQIDLGHCGGCDSPCAFDNAQALCAAGVCSMGACDGAFADCNTDSVDGCEAELGTDVHCAACGNACTGNDFCWQGACTDQCPAGLDNCLGDCVDFDTDPQHCSGCDSPCAYPNAEGLCVGSSCSMGACDANWGDCNGGAIDGCETDLTSDDSHCSQCNDPCTGGTWCWQSACTDQCPGGLSNCSGNCVDLVNDPQHCGACDTPCDYPNAAGSCAASTCSMGACDGGFGDCNANPADGCEVALGDVDNCSACGDACSYANGTASCGALGCALSACDAGFGDCNADLADGCEAGLGTTAHCAVCGDACLYDHADGACNAGVCTMGACYANFEDCNADPADGCEADLRTNATCGSCDQACQPTETCSQGQCESNCSDLDGDSYQAQGCGGDDCNDFDANINPGATEICGDAIDQDCSGADLPCGNCHDNDADGYQDDSCGGVDCDDGNAAVHPGAAEVCGDGIDQDCDGQDESCGGCDDLDGDGHPSDTCGGDDCDDAAAGTYPGAAEICDDGIDQDCDGQDEICGGCQDMDGDGHTPTHCGGLDCDDNNPGIHPGAIDSCGDGIDQNCDGPDRECPSSDTGCACAAAASGPRSFVFVLGLFGLMEYARRRRRL